MRLMSLIIIAPACRFMHYRTANIGLIEQNNYFKPELFKKERRQLIMLVNQYNNRGLNKCYFCNGCGYIPCDKCSAENNNPHSKVVTKCFSCDNTCFKPCHICGDGNGRGGPRYSFVSIIPPAYNLTLS